MYGNRSLAGMGRSDLVRAREQALHPGLGDAARFRREPQRDLMWQQQEESNLITSKRPQQGSLLGDPPLLSASSQRGREASPPRFKGSQQSLSLGARDVREPPIDTYRPREAERHLDFNAGKRMVMGDGASRYGAAASAAARDPLMRAGGALSLEQERMEREQMERERQRQSDRQRRSELQRELELEREKIRRQKEEEEREGKRQEELQRQRDERRREDERARERQRVREQELQRQREKEEERRRIQQEREETEREIERKKAMIEQRGARLQQEIAQNREIRRQEEIEKRRKIELQQMEVQRAREIQMLRQREAAIEQQMSINYTQQQMLQHRVPPPGQVMLVRPPQQQQMMPPPQQGIPSLLTMPKVAPPPTFQPGGVQRNQNNDLMEKVRLQQALLAQQSPSRGQGQNQNRGQGQNQNRGQGQNQNQNRNRNKKKGSRWSSGPPNAADNRNKSGNRNQSGINQSQNRNRSQSGNQSKGRDLSQNRNQAQNRNQSQNRGKTDEKRETVGGGKSPQVGSSKKEGATEVKRTPEKALYDPLHPTDDDVGETPNARKRKQSEGELQVRIEQGKDSRDVLDPPAAKKAALVQEEDRYVATPDQMIREMRQTLPKGMEWMCHLCDAKCPDVMAYHKHMMGKRHQTMMAHIIEVAEVNASEALESLKAENHLARVHRGYAQGANTPNQSAHLCSTCTMYVFGNKDDHRKTEAHKKALGAQQQKCRICNKTFNSLNGFMNHCNTMSHKMLFEVHTMNQQKEATLRAEEAKLKKKHTQPKMFVTVDEVGFEMENEGKEDKAKMEGMIDPMTNEPVDGRRVQQAFRRLLQQKEPQSLVSAAEQAMAAGSLSPMDSPLSQSTPAVGGGPTDKKEPVAWNMKDLVFYNPDKIVGQEYVIPVTGFFCKLCRKFYNSENSARVIHCKSRAHFVHLKKLFEEMQHAAELAKEHIAETSKSVEGATPGEGTKVAAEGEETPPKGTEGEKKAEDAGETDGTADKQESTKNQTEEQEVIKIEDDDDEVVLIPDDEDQAKDGATAEGTKPAEDGGDKMEEKETMDDSVKKQEGNEDGEADAKGDGKAAEGEAEQVMEVGTTEEQQADEAQENGGDTTTEGEEEGTGEESVTEEKKLDGAAVEGGGGDAKMVEQEGAAAKEGGTEAMES